jgi:hypothetical protein
MTTTDSDAKIFEIAAREGLFLRRAGPNGSFLEVMPYHSKAKPFQIQVVHNHRRKALGYYRTAAEAALAYARYCQKHPEQRVISDILVAAEDYDWPTVLKLLQEHPHAATAKGGDSGRTPLHYAITGKARSRRQPPADVALAILKLNPAAATIRDDEDGFCLFI